MNSIPFGTDGLDQFALLRGLAQSQRHGFIAAEATRDLAVGSVVESQRNFDQMNTVVVDDWHESIVVVEIRAWSGTLGDCLLPWIVILTVAYMPGKRARSSLGSSTSTSIVRVF